MMASYQILRVFSAIFFMLPGKTIGNIRLLQKYVALIFLVIQYFAYCLDAPLLSSAGCGNACFAQFGVIVHKELLSLRHWKIF